MIPYHPDEMVEIMKTYDRPWCFTGGWAVDLCLGFQSRAHSDVDICVFRDHIGYFLSYFYDWNIQIESLEREQATPCRSVDDAQAPRERLWLFKGNRYFEAILLTKVENDIVYSMSDKTIRLPYSRIIKHDCYGMPYIAPEWILLMKSRSNADKDIHDFELLLDAKLERSSLHWLYNTLLSVQPHNKWLNRVKDEIRRV